MRRRLRHRGMRRDGRLDLDRRDVAALEADEVGLAIDEVELAGRVAAAEIAGVVPEVAPRLRGQIRRARSSR